MKKFLFNILYVACVTISLYVVTLIVGFAGMDNEFGGKGTSPFYDFVLWTLYGLSVASTIWLAVLVFKFLINKGKKGSRLAWVIAVLLIVGIAGVSYANYNSGQLDDNCENMVKVNSESWYCADNYDAI